MVLRRLDFFHLMPIQWIIPNVLKTTFKRQWQQCHLLLHLLHQSLLMTCHCWEVTLLTLIQVCTWWGEAWWYWRHLTFYIVVIYKVTIRCQWIFSKSRYMSRHTTCCNYTTTSIRSASWLKVSGCNARSAKALHTSTVSASFIRTYLPWTKMMKTCVQNAILKSQMPMIHETSLALFSLAPEPGCGWLCSSIFVI